MFQAEDKVYSSLMTANNSSTVTRVSCSDKGACCLRGFSSEPLGCADLSCRCDEEDRVGDEMAVKGDMGASFVRGFVSLLGRVSANES